MKLYLLTLPCCWPPLASRVVETQAIPVTMTTPITTMAKQPAVKKPAVKKPAKKGGEETGEERR